MGSRISSWGRAALVMGALVAVSGLAAGIGSAVALSPSPSAIPSPGKVVLPSPGKVVLRIGWLGDPDNLNPFIGTTSTAFTVWYMNYDPLVGLDPATLTPDKNIGLASDWTKTNGGKTWTFTIRKNATWQDGQPVTAADVAFTYNYIVKNQASNWTSYTANVQKAVVVDPYTVRFDCSAPTPALLSNFAEVPVLPQHVWSKMPVSKATKSFANAPPIIGSGPFECVQWKKSGYIVMQANKKYWRGAPHVDAVVFEYFTNADSMGEEMRSGAIDACSGLLQAQMKMLAHQSGVVAKPIEVNGYDELGFNCYTRGPSLGNPVLKDPKFRQALQWAVDKNTLCKISYGGMAKPSDTVITADYYHTPDWHWTPPPGEAYSFNLAKASQLLTQAGYPLKNGVRLNKQGKPIKLRLWARSEYPPGVSCGKFLTQWFRELGLKITFSTVDNGALEDGLYNLVKGTFTPNYDMFLWGWYNDIDPGPALSYFTTGQINGWSDCAWSYAPYDALYLEQSHEMDQTKRLQMVRDLQRMIYEQTPYIPLAYSNDTEAWNTSRWTGWVQSPANVGNVVVPPYGFETYFSVKLRAGGGGGGGAGSTGVLIVVCVVVVVAVLAVVTRIVRRRRRAVGVAEE